MSKGVSFVLTKTDLLICMNCPLYLYMYIFGYKKSFQNEKPTKYL